MIRQTLPRYHNSKTLSRRLRTGAFVKMASRRTAFRVHGTVQGVGFRDFTQKRAVEYGLKGWVKNTTCGRVEGEVQGSDETLQKFFKDIDKGPRLAHVVKVEKRDLTPEEGEDHFAVRRTSDSVFEAAK